MKLEDQCVSLEIAKKLKEVGVKQESLFCWWFASNKKYPDWKIINFLLKERNWSYKKK